MKALVELAVWWKEQMRSLVPASLRRSGQARRALVVALEPQHETVLVSLRGGRSARELGRHPLSGQSLRQATSSIAGRLRTRAVLVVPSHLLLERAIVLPLAAERDLVRVVGFEMDRLTPFELDDVMWSCGVVRRDPPRNRLHVRLVLALRREIEPVLAELRRNGITPARLEAEREPALQSSVTLTLAAGGSSLLGRRTAMAAWGLCGVLAATAVSIPFIRQSLELGRLEARMETVRPHVAEAEQLRRTIASASESADALGVAREQVGVPLQALAVLTDALPDDTFLQALSLQARRVTIRGRSANAARLIGIMAANPFIHGPAFTAPVIRDETNGGEGLSLRAELGP